jgi:hypothetical protein
MYDKEHNTPPLKPVHTLSVLVSPPSSTSCVGRAFPHMASQLNGDLKKEKNCDQAGFSPV